LNFIRLCSGLYPRKPSHPRVTSRPRPNQLYVMHISNFTAAIKCYGCTDVQIRSVTCVLSIKSLDKSGKLTDRAMDSIKLVSLHDNIYIYWVRKKKKKATHLMFNL
jgi:hypothetical protein